jgi:predicted nucleotidyltransferase
MARANLFPDFKEFLRSLNSARVKYLLVGGYAVIHHGYRRATDDLDIWIAVDPANARRVSRVLQQFFGFSANEVPETMFLERGRIFMIGREPARIDLLTAPSGIEFAQCYRRRKRAVWDGIRVPLLSLEDLRKNKAASGRPKDLADLYNLPEATPDHRPRRRPHG